METKIFDIEKEKERCLAETGEIIRAGGIVVFPTETVYGLGADALNDEAVKKIFAAKGRPADNPLIVHFCRVEDIDQVCVVTDAAKKLLGKFSPGPITVVLKKRDCVSRYVTAELDTVAVRIPSDETARAFIKAAQRPIAAPSANLSGKPSPTNFRDVYDDMFGRADAIIKGKDSRVGVESTVVDMTGENPVILRPGGVTIADIRTLFPSAEIDKHVTKHVSMLEHPRCPGMKYKHYAPDAEVYVVEGAPDAVRRKIEELVLQNKDKCVGVLSIDGEYDADVVLYAGKDNQEYAKNLFRDLREFDRHGAKIVFAGFVDDDGYGLAVKNRLYKAAANRIIHV